MNLNELFERFVKEKTFLLGVTPKAVRWYRQSWNAFTRTVGTPDVLDRFILNDFVMKLRESGIKPRSCNVYIGGINSFLSWLWESNLIGERLKIKELKEYQLVIPTYTKEHLATFFNWKPKTWPEKRMHALVCTLIDTGARIDIELLPCFRHTFATEYLRSGGGELYLQKALGHSTLTMTRRYAQINENDLKIMHQKTSLLSKMS